MSKENAQPLLDISISSEDQEDTSWIDCADELALSSFARFKDFRKNNQMTDVVIKADGAELSAHRIVLAATIPFFGVMFTTKMIEANSGVVRLPNIDAETLESILNFAYTGRIKFTSNNIERLLRAADYLQLSILSNRCADLLKSRISEKNVFSIRRFALTYNIPQAVTDADSFIQRHFCFVFKTTEFAQLDFSTVSQILSWDQLHIDTEERVFEAVCHWLEYDVPGRHIFAPKLLTAVRMPLIKPSFLIDEISRNQLINNSLECRDLIDEAKNYHLIPERRAQFNTVFKTTIRSCSEVPGVIYALGGLNQLHPSSSPVEFYDPVMKRWSMSKPMTWQRTRIGVAVSDGKIYAIGGYNGNERLRYVEVFDTITGKWTTLQPLHKRRSAMCATALGENIFVIGGYDGGTALDSVESLEIRKSRWVSRPQMLMKRCAAGIAVAKGLIYVIGGHNGVQIFNTVECYDPVAERWQMVSPMLQPRCRLSAATHLNKIYVVGGYHESNFLRSAEVYDPEIDSWTQIAPMNLCRARVSLVANGNFLYAIGGYDGENNLNSMEIYNPEKNQWEFGPPMISHEGGVGVVVVPDIPRLQSKDRPMKRPFNWEDNVREGRGDGGPSTMRKQIG